MTTTTVPIIWENSVKDFDSLNVKEFYTNVDKFLQEFTAEFPLTNVEIHLSRPTKEQGFDRKHFHLKIHLHLKNGKMFLTEAEHADVNLALSVAVRELRHQTDLSDKQKHG